ncbi:hypothetical protein DAPPUDRAFT_264446 [Daphnia pulex]|uniref:Uncharacterized protein n=1 Tax=Daphnia pulex TaxID=6669 RepID=E9HRL6_DAPPU|nr:hypothetical protein DAPPUDRAFT_264446 [Daphnia pulex]|eukprot:EFX65616.1 hypothetical protein DAPPUDRAFT_264446 [Daphnia pulex]
MRRTNNHVEEFHNFLRVLVNANNSPNLIKFIGIVLSEAESIDLQAKLLSQNEALTAISDPVLDILGPGPKWSKRYGAEMVGSKTSEYPLTRQWSRGPLFNLAVLAVKSDREQLYFGFHIGHRAQFFSETSKKDAENMAFFKLASNLFRSKVIEHYGHYREEAERKRQTRNPKVVQAPFMAPNAVQASVMAPNVIQAPVMAPNVAANAATVGVVENASIQDGGRRNRILD